MAADIRRTIAMELHRPVRRNFTRRAEEVKGLHDLYQADLVEMIPHAKLNKVNMYLMAVINAFIKFAYPILLKTKTGTEVARALEPILSTNKMKYLQTDHGKEYYNRSVESVLKR